MEEEEFESTQEDQSQIKHSIERYEEMLRNKDAYFFDVDAFLNIVDFYIERNDPVKELQVIDYAKQQHPASVKYLKLSLDDNPENEIALYELAFCFEFTDKLNESVEFYKQFIDRCPYSFPAWYNLGNVYNRTSDFDQALNAYDYCLVIKDDFSS